MPASNKKMIKQTISNNRNRQHGFVSIPVVMAITLIAAIAYLINSQGAMHVNRVGKEMQADQALYTAQAGISHLLWQSNKANCTGYTDLSNVVFGSNSYSATITPTSGSPVSISATGNHAQGASYSINRDRVKVYQAPPSQLIIQPNAAEGQDTYLYEWKKTWNYGLSTTLWVRNNWANSLAYSLFNFDMSSIPVEAKIISATLELWQNTPSSLGGTVSVQRITTDWIEGTQTGGIGTASWNERDAGVAWSSAGGDSSSIVSASTIIPAATTDWYQWDIASLVSVWVSDAASNKGFILTPESTNTYVKFNSSEHTDPTLRPKLTITYTCECGQTCTATPPETFCEADYTPNTIQSDYSSSAIGSADAQAITYIPEGISFNGVASPAGGAWILIDSVDSKFYMTDMAGALLTSLTMPFGAHGGVFISSGAYANHIALTNTSGGLVYVDMDGNNVSGTLASGSSQAAGIGFVGTSSSGTYDDHILILDRSSETVLIRTQAGATVSSFSVNDGTSMPVQDVTHLPGTDKVIITYDPDKAIIYDFSGTVLREYSLTGFGLTLAESIAINPLTCEHVVADRGSDRVITLNYLPSSTLLFVVADPAGLTAQEAVRKTLIESWGYAVNLIDDNDSQTNFNAALATVDAVYVPVSVDAIALGTKLTAATIGIVNEHSSLISTLGFGQQSINERSLTEIDVVDNTHDITTPFPMGLLTITSSPQILHVMNAGLGDGFEKLATAYNSGVAWDLAMGVIETGGALYGGGSAAGRRALLPWGDNTFDLSQLNAAGQVIMKRSIEWAAGAGGGTPPPSPLESPATFNPSADTYIRGGSTSNFGSSAELKLGRDNGGPYMLSLLRFDISAIPFGSLINSATLRWYQSGNRRTQTVAVGAYQITQDWTESGANWNTADGTTAWSPVSGGTYNTPAIDSVSVTAGNYGWYEWNITPLVQEWVDGMSPNYGVQMNFSTINAGTYAIFTSREGAVASEQPQLVVDFTMP